MDFSGINNLLQNRLFQSILLSAGASLNPQGISPALNQTLQPVIGAQSQAKLNERYIKMLSGILEGGGKLSMDKDKFSLSGPSSLLGGSGELAPGARVAAGLGSSIQSQTVPPQQLETINPFR